MKIQVQINWLGQSTSFLPAKSPWPLTSFSRSCPLVERSTNSSLNLIPSYLISVYQYLFLLYIIIALRHFYHNCVIVPLCAKIILLPSSPRGATARSASHKIPSFYIFSFFPRKFLFRCQAIFNPGGKSVRRVKIFAPTPRHISLKSRQRWYPDGFFWVSVIVGKSHRALEYIGSQNNQKDKGKIEKNKRKICLPDPSPRSPK